VTKTVETLRRTPLYDEHLRLKARMGPFGGWEMPISYSGILDEHGHCRRAAALFDISHMGEFEFRGDIVSDGMGAAVTQPLEKMVPGSCRYGFILNRAGGIVDDLIVLKRSERKLMLVVNAAPAAGDFEVLRERLRGGELEDVSAATAKIDLQGPLSRAVLGAVFGREPQLRYFRFLETEFSGERVLICRAGYTGELGYEIYCSPPAAPSIWKALSADSRVKPAGLGARDILRLEMGYSLYGSDIDDETSPLEAGLGAFLNFDKEFVGRAALEEEKARGPRRVKVAFTTPGRRAPRRHYRIETAGEPVGAVTSGTFSPALGCGIGMGFVRPGSEGEPLTVTDGASVRLEVRPAILPFYSGGSLRT